MNNYFMKRIGMAGLGILLLAAPLYAEEQLTLKTRIDKESYSTGVDFVRSLKERGGQIDLDLVIRGMKDGLTGESMLMSEDDLRKTLASRGMTNELDNAHSAPDALELNSTPAVPQKQIKPGADDPGMSTSTFAKKEMQARKQGEDSGDIVPAVPYTQSVAARGHTRNALKLRALELRRRSIEQGL